MPDISAAEIVTHLLTKEGYPEDVIAKVKSFIEANDPKKAEQFAQDRAIAQQRSEKFNDRFPNAKRVGRV